MFSLALYFFLIGSVKLTLEWVRDTNTFSKKTVVVSGNLEMNMSKVNKKLFLYDHFTVLSQNYIMVCICGEVTSVHYEYFMQRNGECRSIPWHMFQRYSNSLIVGYVF